METSGVQVPDPETLGQSQPGGEVLGVLHLDKQQPCLAFGARIEVLRAGRHCVVPFVQDLSSSHLLLQAVLILLLLHAVHVGQLHVPLGVEGVLGEVDVVEVGVHVEPRGAKVVGSGDVWHDALPSPPDLLQPHPHVPVPGFLRAWPSRLQLLAPKAPLEDPTKSRHCFHPVEHGGVG